MTVIEEERRPKGSQAATAMQILGTLEDGKDDDQG